MNKSGRMYGVSKHTKVMLQELPRLKRLPVISNLWKRLSSNQTFKFSRLFNSPRRKKHVPFYFSSLDYRVLLSGTPELPGLTLVDPNPENLQGQIVYLDFDGEEDVTYKGPITVEHIKIPSFQAPELLQGQETVIINEVLESLNDLFSNVGVQFVTEKPDSSIEYSIIYIGGTDASFSDFGSFSGLAEHVDIGNLHRKDIGFVFSEKVGSQFTDLDELTSSIFTLTAHEAGHLLGYRHTNQNEMLQDGDWNLNAVASSFDLIEVIKSKDLGSVNLNGNGVAEQGVAYIPGHGWVTSSGSSAVLGLLEGEDSAITWFDESWSELIGGQIIYEGEKNFSFFKNGKVVNNDVVHIGDISYGDDGYIYVPLQLDEILEADGSPDWEFIARYETDGSLDTNWGIVLESDDIAVSGVSYYEGNLYLAEYVKSETQDQWAKARIIVYDIANTIQDPVTYYVSIPYINGLAIQSVNKVPYVHMTFGGHSFDFNAPVHVGFGFEGTGGIAVLPLEELLLHTSDPYDLSRSDYYTYNSRPHAEGLTFDDNGNLWVTRGTEVAQLDTSVIDYAPSVDQFVVEDSLIFQGGQARFSVTVSDDVSTGLNRVELWRANDIGGLPSSYWTEITRVDINGAGPVSIALTDDELISTGSYWYGIHVVDNAGNLTQTSPIKVTVSELPSNLDLFGPTATLSFPTNGASVSQSLVNENPKYIDVTFSDTGGSGLNLDTITDSGAEFTINGITINGSPTLVSGNRYRYSFTGSLSLGTATVNFIAGTWSDNQGNLNSASTQTFNVSSAPVITSVNPAALVPLPVDERQWLTIYGSGFSANSTLNFTSSLGNRFTGRVPVFNASTGSLSYNISVGTTEGQWAVTVVTNGIESDPFMFNVSSSSAVLTPTISPDGGTFNGPVQVTLVTDTSGATIHYTLDGSDPTSSSNKYTGPLTIGSSLTLKARAFKDGMPSSNVAFESFSISTEPSAPVITRLSPRVLERTSELQEIDIYGVGFKAGVEVFVYDTENDESTPAIIDGDPEHLEVLVRVGSKLPGTWRLFVVNPDGKQSNTMTFTVNESPTGNYPTLLYPLVNQTSVQRDEDKRITFQWEPVAGASTYRLKFAEDPSELPRDPMIGGGFSTSETSESIRFGNGDSGKTIYWQVKAKIDDVWHAWSPIWSFTLEGELNLPPVIENAWVSKSTITQGEEVQFFASGVWDPNSDSDEIERVIWYKETNGIPGYQWDINIPADERDETIESDRDGSDGWSEVEATYGDKYPDDLYAGTHVIYAVAEDKYGFYSDPAGPITLTVLPNDEPAPELISFFHDPLESTINFTFNIDLSQGRSDILGALYTYSDGFLDPLRYDQDSYTVTYAIKNEIGDYYASMSTPDLIHNASGEEYVGQNKFSYFVLPGDVNKDRTVDGQDVEILEENFGNGSGKSWLEGDFTGDGVVDEMDLTILNENIGETVEVNRWDFVRAPDNPSNLEPANQSNISSIYPLLNASDFSTIYDGDTHLASQWVVFRSSDSKVVFNSGEDTENKTSIQVNSLDYNTEYYWKVRYKSDKGTWTNYSETTTFITELAPNQPPAVTVGTPKGFQDGDVTIAYALGDTDSDSSSIVVEYSRDAGNSWQIATPAQGGDGLANLTSSPTGILHTFVWDSDSDLGDTPEQNVMIRIVPYDDAEGRAGTTQSFSIGLPNAGVDVHIRSLLSRSGFIAGLLMPTADSNSTDGTGGSPFAQREGTDFYVEIWVRSDQTNADGISSGSVELTFDTAYGQVMSVEHGELFTDSPIEVIDNTTGSVQLGGLTSQTDQGDDEYVLLGRVVFQGQVPVDEVNQVWDTQNLNLQVNESSLLFTLNEMGEVTGTLQEVPTISIRPMIYDVNDDGRVNFSDLGVFASAFREGTVSDDGPPYTRWADFNNDGRVNFSDLGLFASAFRGGANDTSDVPFPDWWKQSHAVGALVQTQSLVAPPSAANQMALVHDDDSNTLALAFASVSVPNRMASNVLTSLSRLQLQVVGEDENDSDAPMADWLKAENYTLSDVG